MKISIMFILLSVSVSAQFKTMFIDENTPVFKLEGYMGKELEKKFYKFLKELKPGKPILVYIDTEGGNLGVTLRMILAMMDADRESGCHVREAASGGFIFLQACGFRSMERTSSLMIHNIQILGELKPKDAENLKGIQLYIDTNIAERMNLSVEEYRKYVGKGDKWFAWDEALKMKIIDVIYKKVICEPKAIENGICPL